MYSSSCLEFYSHFSLLSVDFSKIYGIDCCLILQVNDNLFIHLLLNKKVSYFHVRAVTNIAEVRFQKELLSFLFLYLCLFISLLCTVSYKYVMYTDQSFLLPSLIFLLSLSLSLLPTCTFLRFMSFYLFCDSLSLARAVFTF